MKRCSSCKIEKPPSEFHRSGSTRDGLHTKCKPCRRQQTTRWRASKGGPDYGVAYHARLTAVRELRSRGLARCLTCNEVKALSDFTRGRAATECKPCNAARVRAYWRAMPPEERAVRVFANNQRASRDLRTDPQARRFVLMLRRDPCAYCGAPCEHIDHIRPVSKGGDNAWDNLTASCASCNQAKNARDLLGFLMLMSSTPVLDL